MAIDNSSETVESQRFLALDNALTAVCEPRHEDPVDAWGSDVDTNVLIAYQGRLLPLQRLLVTLAELERQAEEGVRTGSNEEKDRHAEVAIWADCSISALRNECMFCRTPLAGAQPVEDGLVECPCCGEQLEQYTADASFCGIDVAVELMLNEGVEMPVDHRTLGTSPVL